MGSMHALTGFAFAIFGVRHRFAVAVAFSVWTPAFALRSRRPHPTVSTLSSLLKRGRSGSRCRNLQKAGEGVC